MALLFFGMLFLLILINVYDGFKIKRCFGEHKKYYYYIGLPLHILFFIIFLMIFFFRGSDNYFGNILSTVGYGFIAASFYMFIMFVPANILRFIFNKAGIKGGFRKVVSKIYCRGIIVVVISVCSVIFGIFNAYDIKVKHYDVSVEKGKSNIDELNVVMFSDTHIGTTIREDEIDEIVEKVNALKPDIIYLCGDIFDEGTSDRLKEYAKNAFSKFESKYGAFYITGNHEYYTGNSDEAVKYIESSEITVLEDKYQLVDNNFYVVGRIDEAVFREKGVERKELSEIIEGIDKEIPIMLLDHRPVGIMKSKENGVDLQFSGHTHAGQIFPINFLSSLSNDLNYGYLKDDEYNIIVSSGCGTWGVPIRIGSDTEIVNVNVKFE